MFLKIKLKHIVGITFTLIVCYLFFIGVSKYYYGKGYQIGILCQEYFQKYNDKNYIFSSHNITEKSITECNFFFNLDKNIFIDNNFNQY